jgi:hypothetical protein
VIPFLVLVDSVRTEAMTQLPRVGMLDSEKSKNPSKHKEFNSSLLLHRKIIITHNNLTAIYTFSFFSSRASLRFSYTGKDIFMKELYLLKD